MSVFTIAEIGINHNGDIEIAKKLIRQAKRCGFDAVKFQKRTIEEVYSKEEFKDSQEFLKKELKKIISTVQDKLIKHDDNNEITFKKNKLKSIVELYAESGKWDYWSIED